MKTKKTEIEIKVKVEKIQPLLTFLKHKAIFQKEILQIDEYFIPAHRNFIKERPIKEWLRLRKTDRHSLTYKRYHFDKDGKSYESDEFEIEISDLSQAKKILKALNFESIIIVNKTRKVWTYYEYEIAVDKVEKLGEFVEIEFIGKNRGKPAKQIASEMVDFLKSLNCGDIYRNFQGYPFLLLFKNDAKYYKEK